MTRTATTSFNQTRQRANSSKRFKSFSSSTKQQPNISPESAENLMYEMKKYDEDVNVQLIGTKNGQLIPKDKELKAYLDSKFLILSHFMILSIIEIFRFFL